jgi:hypothetical protein
LRSDFGQKSIDRVDRHPVGFGARDSMADMDRSTLKAEQLSRIDLHGNWRTGLYRRDSSFFITVRVATTRRAAIQIITGWGR